MPRWYRMLQGEATSTISTHLVPFEQSEIASITGSGRGGGMHATARPRPLLRNMRRKPECAAEEVEGESGPVDRIAEELGDCFCGAFQRDRVAVRGHHTRSGCSGTQLAGAFDDLL